MAQSRVYDFNPGFETSTQPDASTPTLSNDVATKGYVDGAFALGGTDIQEVPTGVVDGVNDTFTISQTPANTGCVLLFQNGLLMRQGTDYTIAGTTITMTDPPVTGQTLDVYYRY